MGNGSSIADVHCPKCGAPAKYDIVRGSYQCGFCGSSVQINEALAEKQGFQKLQQEKIRKSAERYRLMRASCSGCGAEIVFDENEAMSGCAFCGRALVRKDYIQSEDMPEMILPFRITREEAAECLNSWCRKNSGKAEAKHLSADIGALQSFYLPYELIRGPVTSRVSRMDSSRVYTCGSASGSTRRSQTTIRRWCRKRWRRKRWRCLRTRLPCCACRCCCLSVTCRRGRPQPL